MHAHREAALHTWTARRRGLVPEPTPTTSTRVPGGRGRPDTTRPRSDQPSLELRMSRCPSSSAASSPHSPPPSPVVACPTGLVCPWASPPAHLPYGDARACARCMYVCGVRRLKRIGALGRRHLPVPSFTCLPACCSHTYILPPATYLRTYMPPCTLPSLAPPRYAGRERQADAHQLRAP